MRMIPAAVARCPVCGVETMLVQPEALKALEHYQMVGVQCQTQGCGKFRIGRRMVRLK